MKNKRKYTLYCNNIPTSNIEDIRLCLYNIDSNISFDIVEINNKDGEASRGIPAVGISLYCYFITDKELEYKTSATKIYDNGLGYGICLVNIDVDNFLKQFNHIETKDELIKEIESKIVSSIQFCEKYINVNF